MHDAGEAVQCASRKLYLAPDTCAVVVDFESLTCQRSGWHSLSRFPGREHAGVGYGYIEPGGRGRCARFLEFLWKTRMACSGTLPAAVDLVHSGSLFHMNALPHRRRSAADFFKQSRTRGDQAWFPVLSRSRISMSNFSSPDGPARGAGFLKRLTCLITRNRQKAIIKNSITVLMKSP
jgi:hypothetical protein